MGADRITWGAVTVIGKALTTLPDAGATADEEWVRLKAVITI